MFYPLSIHIVNDYKYTFYFYKEEHEDRREQLQRQRDSVLFHVRKGDLVHGIVPLFIVASYSFV